MSVKDLKPSNMVLKQQCYPQQKNKPSFQFQHHPITHQVQKGEVHQQKRLTRDLQLKQRKYVLEESQRIKKQKLLRKIVAKNCRFEIRQNGDLQNKKNVQISRLLSRNKSSELQKLIDPQKAKVQNKNVQKIYLNSQKAQLSPTKGISGNKDRDQMVVKAVNRQEPNQIKTKQVKQFKQSKKFKQIKLRGVKLPQLNCMKQEQVLKGEVNAAYRPQIGQKQDQIQKKKARNQIRTNPILKVHDVRYFGIEQRQEDFDRVQKSLLKQIRIKYWSYESLDHEQVYNNFQNILAQQFA